MSLGHGYQSSKIRLFFKNTLKKIKKLQPACLPQV